MRRAAASNANAGKLQQGQQTASIRAEAVPAASADEQRLDDTGIEIEIGEEFEECLEFKWKPKEPCREFMLEMVIDRSDRSKRGSGPLKPAKDAMVKRVNMGADEEGSIQNMPEGRNFLVRVIGKKASGGSKDEIFSPWTRACTLSPKTREKDLGNLDPMNMPRMNCLNCPCACYVPFRWGLNSPGRLRCRRCGCHHTEHLMVEVGEILKARELKAKASLSREVTPLPQEALSWDERECALWFWSAGLVHPRQIAGEFRTKAASPKPSESEGGVKGRVSIVTPTTEARQKFHEQLWRCFDAQKWPDKELVIVETYWDNPSDFFQMKAQSDNRVVYVKFKRPMGEDWSIGLKRNVGTHLASGEFIASFDDDDLYAPSYCSTMLSALQESRAVAVKLSNWYVYHMGTDEWTFCDPIAWGLTKGLDETSDKVKSWAYGYGFSYVYRRQAGLDVWYQDINLGEDFNFMMQLQIRRGEKSIHLVQDDFGICLHIQHGGNTSNSIPVRKVDDLEAADLDIMELCSCLHSAGPAWRALAHGSGRGRAAGGLRKVHCNLPAAATDVPAQWSADVECPARATVCTLLEGLCAVIRRSCEGYKVYRVPPTVAFGPSGRIHSEKSRDEFAADVLGISYLAELPGADENLKPNTKSGHQWRRLLQAARAPLRGSARLGPRTKEVWVVPPELLGAAGAAAGEETWEEEDKEACESAAEESESSFVARVTCQSSTVKKFFAAKQSFGVWLKKGATVADLRWVLGRWLPPEARVLTEREGRGISALQETDAVPTQITVSDFRGSRSFYMRFTNRQCGIVLRFMRSFFKNPVNQRCLDEFEVASKGSGHDYRAQLVQLLAHEVYPRIYQKLNVPLVDDLDGPKLMLEAMSNVAQSNLEVCELWLEVETLMRNKASAEQAQQSITFFKAKQQGVFLDAPSTGGLSDEQKRRFEASLQMSDSQAASYAMQLFDMRFGHMLKLHEEQEKIEQRLRQREQRQAHEDAEAEATSEAKCDPQNLSAAAQPADSSGVIPCESAESSRGYATSPAPAEDVAPSPAATRSTQTSPKAKDPPTSHSQAQEKDMQPEPTHKTTTSTAPTQIFETTGVPTQDVATLPQMIQSTPISPTQNFATPVTSSQNAPTSSALAQDAPVPQAPLEDSTAQAPTPGALASPASPRRAATSLTLLPHTATLPAPTQDTSASPAPMLDTDTAPAPTQDVARLPTTMRGNVMQNAFIQSTAKSPTPVPDAATPPAQTQDTVKSPTLLPDTAKPPAPTHDTATSPTSTPETVTPLALAHDTVPSLSLAADSDTPPATTQDPATSPADVQDTENSSAPMQDSATPPEPSQDNEAPPASIQAPQATPRAEAESEESTEQQSPRTTAAFLDWDALERMEAAQAAGAGMETEVSAAAAQQLARLTRKETSATSIIAKSNVSSAPVSSESSTERTVRAARPATAAGARSCNVSAGPSPGAAQASASESLDTVEVCVRHGTQAGEITVMVPANATMLQVKRTLARRTGRKSPGAVNRMRLVERTGNTFSTFSDDETLSGRRELLVLGLGLQTSQLQSPATNDRFAYASVAVSVAHPVTGEQIEVNVSEMATMSDVKETLRRKPEAHAFHHLLAAGGHLAVFSASAEMAEPLADSEPLRGRWSLTICEGRKGDDAIASRNNGERTADLYLSSSSLHQNEA